jgi:prepilin-type N-terminal cleavage/methylation domain-containing protein
MNKSKSGFTIVELLVVIVVIAILATISVVAYSGITQRAKTSQVLANMDGWSKTVEMLRVLDEPWPGIVSTTSLGGWRTSGQFCLGRAEDYPAKETFPAGACYKVIPNSGGSPVYTYFNEAEYMGWPASIDRPSGATIDTRLKQDGATVTIYSRGLLGFRAIQDGGVEEFSILYSPQISGMCVQGWVNLPNGGPSSLEGERCQRKFTR